jgi:diguanylate cyclase (GGDEF)-like protein/PAS domain S-box-containing protein
MPDDSPEPPPREARRQFRRAFENAATGFSITSADGRLLEVNTAFAALLGLTREELQGKTVVEVTHPDDRDVSARAMGDALNGTVEGVQLQKRFLHADGHAVPALVSSALIRDEHGRPWYFTTQVIDLTERERAERERSAADHQFRTAFEAAPIGMLMVDLEGRFLHANHAIVDITGYALDKLPDLEPFVFVHPDDVAAVRERFGTLRNGAESAGIEHRIVRADGRVTWVDARVTLMRDQDGRPSYALAQLNDITDRRDHEEALRRHAEQLEAIAKVARAVGHSDPQDARRAVCRTALGVADGATAISILEYQPDGSLQVTAALPEVPKPWRVPPDNSDHGAHVVMRSGRPLLVADASDSPHVDPDVVAADRVRSVLFLPIGQTPRGVLAVGWPHPRDEVSDELGLLFAVLADEAAVAMQRADLLARLDELTRTDELTGLPNRRAWDDVFERELAAARRHGQPLSVAMLDLDHFKAYNDRHGHLAGDGLLRDAAAAWLQHLRASDVLARWGGEEFVLLLPGTTAPQAAELVLRLRGLLPDNVTFSAGVAASDGSVSARALLNAADQALYDAKAAGRDRVVIG